MSDIPRTLSVTVPIRTVSESNARGHWASRARRACEQRAVVRFALLPSLIGIRLAHVWPHQTKASPHFDVLLTRIAPRDLDDDNLRGALKACRDGVADALLLDDRSPWLTWVYAQERGKPKEYAVRIVIEAWQ